MRKCQNSTNQSEEIANSKCGGLAAHRIDRYCAMYASVFDEHLACRAIAHEQDVETGLQALDASSLEGVDCYYGSFGSLGFGNLGSALGILDS